MFVFSRKMTSNIKSIIKRRTYYCYSHLIRDKRTNNLAISHAHCQRLEIDREALGECTVYLIYYFFSSPLTGIFISSVLSVCYPFDNNLYWVQNFSDAFSLPLFDLCALPSLPLAGIHKMWWPMETKLASQLAFSRLLGIHTDIIHVYTNCLYTVRSRK